MKAMLDNPFIICPQKKCTGCGVCTFVCKHNAISLQADKCGNYYPIIDEKRCVNCGLCKKKCPSVTHEAQSNSTFPFAAYVCYNSNDKERAKSSSGGLGHLLAQYMIERGGVAYGCAFITPNRVQHIRCSNTEEIQRLRGSKYVQSDISNIYPNIEEDLKAGVEVLFIGTPCQVAGVKTTFAKFKNLFIVDLVCHGVPSMKLLQDTLPVLDTQPFDMQFRRGNKFHFSLHSQSGEVIFERNLSNDMFMKGFFNGTIYRPNCYRCLYAQHERISDITIGDFWGCKSTKMVNVKHGISLALINSSHGKILFEGCLSHMEVDQRPIEEAFAGNEQLNHPFKENYRSKVFKSLYPKLGYNKALWCALPDKVIAMKLKNILYKVRHHED